MLHNKGSMLDELMKKKSIEYDKGLLPYFFHHSSLHRYHLLVANHEVGFDKLMDIMWPIIQITFPCISFLYLLKQNLFTVILE